MRTRVGYAGGAAKNPTYHNLGDHSETIQIDFDPERISYEDLLRVFWQSHNPVHRPWSRQYMSVIFHHSEEQKELALKTRAEEEVRRRSKIYTEIVPAAQFYLAENYHQKYWLRQVKELMKEFREMYPRDEDLANSTAAARINGFIAGYGSARTLKEELKSYGLSREGEHKLLHIGRILEAEKVRL